jgi:hypothetical protein
VVGSLAGVDVRACPSPRERLFHEGYRARAVDEHDLALLAALDD